jgi:hypothetical protein
MTHLGLYFSCVFARATQWKPKPLKPVWGISFVCLAVLIAGMVCGIAGRDIHILYWWLLGAPAVAIGIPLMMVSITLLARLFMRLIFRFFRAINNHDA